MDSVLVDTDVASFIFKQDTRETLYQPHLAGKQVCIAFMTVAELYYWAISKKWGKLKDAWIAATALRHGLPLVTHNRRHFESIPALRVISES